MKVPFERAAQLIAIGALDRNSVLLPVLSINDSDLELDFEDYVKSQIHLYLVGDLYSDRTMQDYINALEYLENRNKDPASMYKVFHFFYTDMLNFLVMNSGNVRLSLGVPRELKSFAISQQDIVQERMMLEHLCSKPMKFEELVDFVNAFSCSELFDIMDSLADVNAKLDSCAMVVHLIKQLKSLEEKFNGIQGKSRKL